MRHEYFANATGKLLKILSVSKKAGFQDIESLRDCFLCSVSVDISSWYWNLSILRAPVHTFMLYVGSEKTKVSQDRKGFIWNVCYDIHAAAREFYGGAGNGSSEMYAGES